MAADRHAPEGATRQRQDWIAAALCGALAWTPGLLAIVGWASHWNAYTNLTLTLIAPVYWLVMWKSWSE